ncbi:MAG: hypothetical protein ABIR96_10050 [Bdellovibrionota bacterium]
MSQQSDMADAVYGRLSEGPVPTAHLVRELRDRWGGGHGVSAVHGFVREVATCLLWRGDVDLGDFKEGGFVSWSLEPEDANTRIDEELMSADAFLEDQSRYVFRKKQSA